MNIIDCPCGTSFVSYDNTMKCPSCERSHNNIMNMKVMKVYSMTTASPILRCELFLNGKYVIFETPIDYRLTEKKQEMITTINESIGKALSAILFDSRNVEII